MKVIFSAFIFVLSTYSLGLKAGPWEPANGNVQIRLWPGSAPEGHKVHGLENSEIVDKENEKVAGKPWLWITNVDEPTVTVYSPTKFNTGAAVIVFPGGGYDGLAIDLEGTEVCDWLTAKGVTCVLLKYRVPHSGPQWNSKCKCNIFPKIPAALQDAQRAVGYVRFHCAKWKIDPNKIGVLGFSAGGHLVAAISTNFQKRVYTHVDPADHTSCRPDFAIALYPGHISDDLKNINKDLLFTAKTPPTILIQAVDDPVDHVEYSTLYFAALKKVGVSVEMHLFAQGKHAFGLRPTEHPITKWPHLVDKWMVAIGMTPK
jgi:acetyl esterase/lipase